MCGFSPVFDILISGLRSAVEASLGWTPAALRWIQTEDSTDQLLHPDSKVLLHLHSEVTAPRGTQHLSHQTAQFLRLMSEAENEAAQSCSEITTPEKNEQNGTQNNQNQT